MGARGYRPPRRRRDARAVQRLSQLGLGLALVTLTVMAAGAPRVMGKRLSRVAKAVLVEVLEQAELPSAKVTAVARSPEKQAQIMYDICHSEGGVERAKDMYAKSSEAIVDVYLAHKKRPRDEVIARMAREIERVIDELGPDRKTMRHVSDERYAFDVDPSSLADAARFEAAAKVHPAVARFLGPERSGHDAYHIEVFQNSLPITGMWQGQCDTAKSESDEQTKPDEATDKPPLSGKIYLSLRSENDAFQAKIKVGDRVVNLSDVKLDDQTGRLSFLVEQRKTRAVASFNLTRTSMRLEYDAVVCQLSRVPKSKARRSDARAGRATRARTRGSAPHKRAPRQR